MSNVESYMRDSEIVANADSHTSYDSLRNESYQIQEIVTNTDDIDNITSGTSIKRMKTNNSTLSRIVTAIRDDHQQDNDEFPQYKDKAYLEEVLDMRLAFTSGDNDGDQESNIVLYRKSEKDYNEKEYTDEKYDDVNNDPPDGGYGWVSAFCAMLAAFSTWGSNAGYGVFLNYYLSSNSFPEATPYDYALIGGIVVFLAQVLAPLSVLGYKMFGFYNLSFCGIFIQTSGYILASFATKLWQVYLTQGVLVGLSFLMIFIPPTLILPTYFKKYRAFAMGIAVSGGGLGGIVFSLSVNKLIQQTGDLKWALRMSGIVTFVLALIATVLNKPRNYKPLPFSTTLKAKFIKDNLKVILDFSIFKNYPFALITLWFLLCLLGYILMLFSMAAYSNLVGLTSHVASTITALLNAGQVFGRPSLGILADRVGRNNFSATVSLLISILLWAFWINATSFPAIAVFAIVLGLFIGIGSVMSQSLAADILQDEGKLPAAWSYLNMGSLFFCLVAEVIALAIRDESNDKPFLNTQIFSGCCFFVAFLLLLIIREWLVRRTLNNRLNTAQSGITNTERKMHLHSHNLQDVEKGEYNGTPELELLEARVAKYENLLSKSILYFFVRMFYPIRV